MKNLDTEYELLKILEQNPYITQRDVSSELGVSLGKTHYVMRALIDKGLIKLENFQRSNSKQGYAYFLTPAGIKEKSRLTWEFLRIKQNEYDRLKQEIENLKEEVKQDNN